jgi:hypothetical protein
VVAHVVSPVVAVDFQVIDAIRQFFSGGFERADLSSTSPRDTTIQETIALIDDHYHFHIQVELAWAI